MEQKIDLNKAPKQFCESISAGFSEEFFVLAMLNGTNANVFAITPEHAKRLAQYMTHQVSEYEKKHGEIQTEWTPGVQSPIQIEGESDTPPNEK